MDLTVFWILLLLLAFYALIIAGLVALVERLDAGRGLSVLWAFSIFGLLTGLMVAWVWPYDSSIYLNFPAVLVSDAVYGWATRTIAPGSAEAHARIPWLLRIPQLYIWVSIVLSGLVGLVFQLILFNRRPGHRDR